MRTVELGSELEQRLRAASREGYPDEVCGFLFCSEREANGARRTIRGLEAAPNTYAGERRRRFVIAPEELRSAELRALGRAQVVAGFYHSHPDHPARPSAFDQEHAWPWYTYLVLSIDAHGDGALAAFELEPENQRFLPCSLDVVGEGALAASPSSSRGP